MSDELRPCPFCGATPANLRGVGNGWLSVVCDCNAEGPPGKGDAAAYAAWNRRAGDAETEQHGPRCQCDRCQDSRL